MNFNSGKKIFKSLFMIHNESVNVWTHLLGSLFVISLFIYTGIFIKKRYLDVDAMQNKFSYIKQELYSLKTPLLETMHYFDNFTERIEQSAHTVNEYIGLISNKTVNYFHNFDEKLNEYRDYISTRINCLGCLKEIYGNFTNFTEHYLTIDIQKVKQRLINESTVLINSFNISSIEEYINRTNTQLIKFRDRIIDNLESKEMEWIDIYTMTKEGKNDHVVKKWPLFVFLFGAIVCLSMSTFFHLCHVHSEEFANFVARLDYAGISLLIAGSCFPIYYYSYFCFDCKLYI